MRFPERVLTMIAGILLILMTLGCDAPAGSAASGAVSAVEPLLEEVPAGPSNTSKEAASELPELEAEAERGFRGGTGIDDPFAAAFSGLGFQTHSSGCDPFEDAYGTCL